MEMNTKMLHCGLLGPLRIETSFKNKVLKIKLFHESNHCQTFPV
jgi:hypothetical protein